MKRAKVPALKTAALKIDVMVDSKRWKDPTSVQSIVRSAVRRAAAASRSTSGAELAIVLTDDSAIRLLNRDWRGIDKATNVLSFPAKPGGHEPHRPKPHLGDIVLAFETIAREAETEHKPFAHHVAHLAVHGFLHLVGYDHERDEDAREMEQAERDILRQLKIPDPYGSIPVARKIVVRKTVSRDRQRSRSSKSRTRKS
jgi:probable rRNA maturation factor